MTDQVDTPFQNSLTLEGELVDDIEVRQMKGGLNEYCLLKVRTEEEYWDRKSDSLQVRDDTHLILVFSQSKVRFLKLNSPPAGSWVRAVGKMQSRIVGDNWKACLALHKDEGNFQCWPNRPAREE